MFDLHPAAARMSALVTGIGSEQLDAPTPCDGWSVTDLLAHIQQFTVVFIANAAKAPVVLPDGLVEDWRTQLPDRLVELAHVWRNGAAWEGRVSAGGVDMAAADNAIVAIEELTVHGWDLARATGQPFDADDADLDEVDRFYDLFGGTPYGPPVDTSAAPTRLDRTIARAGRDPSWPGPVAP